MASIDSGEFSSGCTASGSDLPACKRRGFFCSGRTTSSGRQASVTVKLPALAVAENGQLDRSARLGLRQRPLQVAALVDRLVIDGRDAVARLQAGLGGRRAGADDLHGATIVLAHRPP